MPSPEITSQVAKNSAKVRKRIISNISYTPLIKSKANPFLFFNQKISS